MKHWRDKGWIALVLLPLSWLFGAIVRVRRLLYSTNVLQTYNVPVPVIVVGNIYVGGVGKSPVVAAVCRLLRQQGWKPGIVSRGYGGDYVQEPVLLDDESTPENVGDEPVMLRLLTRSPISVAKRRYLAAQQLVDEGCDIIVADDGLQHYALNRDIEICIIDSDLKIGNGFLLPAGPLREPVSRLNDVDYLLMSRFGLNAKNGYSFDVRLNGLFDVHTGESVTLEKGQGVHAVCGIGNPQKFFSSLESLGYVLHKHAFPDHHRYIAADITFNDGMPVVMTAKDAVKCRRFALHNLCYLDIDIEFSVEFKKSLNEKLRLLRKQ